MPDRRPRAALAAAALLAAALLPAGGCAAADALQQGSAAAPAAGAPAVTFAVADRRPAPDLAGEDLDGTPQSLAALRGHVVVLNIWGSWCGPCRAEADGLQRVHTETETQGVRFLGIDTKDPQPGPARTFVRDHGLTYPSLYDPKGALVRTLPPQTVNVQALPATLVVDRAGRIAAAVAAPVTPEQLHAVLDPITAEAATP
ncbi:TlpA family protein disulfide reductase [Kitasatospora sp. NPDC048365]|uniref:TlpA family protein disulfide reductase n=1 Tax=Kitasatospora sp. NPDC048365 TaxID=3364050 RepID=UPI003720C72D